MITKAQWEEVEHHIGRGFIGQCSLRLGDDRVTLYRAFISANELVVAVYINDIIDTSNINNPSDTAKLLWRPIIKSVYSAKQKANFKKNSKNRLKELKDCFGIDPDEKRIFYSPYFKSFAVLKRQYSKIKDLEFLC